MNQQQERKTYVTGYDIYFEDISPSGIVHLEKIAEWMSMGRERFFRDTCPDHMWLAEAKTAIFTVSMSISVKGNSRWADEVNAVIYVSEVKRISYKVHFEFVNKRTGKIIAEGEQKVGVVNMETGRLAPVPEDIKNVVVQYSK